MKPVHVAAIKNLRNAANLFLRLKQQKELRGIMIFGEQRC